MEPIDAEAIPGSESRSTQFTLMGAGDRGWGCAGTLPSYPKGIPDDSVAAGGCPAPFRRNGVRRLKGAASRRGAGLTADLPRLRRGKGR